MKDMAAMQGMNMFGSLPESWNVVINSNHSSSSKLIKLADNGEKEALLKNAFDLALLSQNALQGEALTNFINRSYGML
jgi:molecular chaperone HtpG